MTWNGRYRCAVTISVDFDAESLWSGTFKLTTPSPLSRGDYDIRAGIPRILDLMHRHEIPATFMVPGQVMDDHPDTCREIAEHNKNTTGPQVKRKPSYSAIRQDIKRRKDERAETQKTQK